jgi:alpha-tubulin suppressor-like RCC1 family protein
MHNFILMKNSTNQVYAFGDGSSGQLGITEVPSSGYVTAPRQLKPHWQNNQTHANEARQAGQ